MMHMRGTPQTMQSLTTYEDIIKNVVEKHAVYNDLIIDPGFGFAKQ
jgi:dihydropteroate synthase